MIRYIRKIKIEMGKGKGILMGLYRKDENITVEKMSDLESFSMNFSLYSVIYYYCDLS